MAELQRVQPGWSVYGSDRQPIGSVRVVGRDYLEVEKGTFFLKTLFIPSSAVAKVDETGRIVVLRVSREAVGDLGWTRPPFDAAPDHPGGPASSGEGEAPDAGYYGTWDERELDAAGMPAGRVGGQPGEGYWGQAASPVASSEPEVRAYPNAGGSEPDSGGEREARSQGDEQGPT